MGDAAEAAAGRRAAGLPGKRPVSTMLLGKGCKRPAAARQHASILPPPADVRGAAPLGAALLRGGHHEDGPFAQVMMRTLHQELFPAATRHGDAAEGRRASFAECIRAIPPSLLATLLTTGGAPPHGSLAVSEEDLVTIERIHANFEPITDPIWERLAARHAGRDQALAGGEDARRRAGESGRAFYLRTKAAEGARLDEARARLRDGYLRESQKVRTLKVISGAPAPHHAAAGRRRTTAGGRAAAAAARGERGSAAAEPQLHSSLMTRARRECLGGGRPAAPPSAAQQTRRGMLIPPKR